MIGLTPEHRELHASVRRLVLAEAIQEIDCASVRDREHVPEGGHGFEPLEDPGQVFAPTLSAGDHEVSVQTLEGSKFRRIPAAALIRCQALEDPERGYGRLDIDLDPDALEHLVEVSDGDARSLLNALELAVETTPPDEYGLINITTEVAEESIQQRAVLYDKDGLLKGYVVGVQSTNTLTGQFSFYLFEFCLF